MSRATASVIIGELGGIVLLSLILVFTGMILDRIGKGR